MGGSNKGRSRTEKTEILKKKSKGQRRSNDKKIIKQEKDSL